MFTLTKTAALKAFHAIPFKSPKDILEGISFRQYLQFALTLKSEHLDASMLHVFGAYHGLVNACHYMCLSDPIGLAAWSLYSHHLDEENVVFFEESEASEQILPADLRNKQQMPTPVLQQKILDAGLAKIRNSLSIRNYW